MPEPTLQETAARAVVKEAPTAGRPNQEFQSKINEKVDAEGSKKALETQLGSIDKQKFERKKEAFGINYDDEGKKTIAEPEEIDRLNKYSNEGERNRRLYESGLDSFTDSAERRAIVQKFIEGAVSNPTVANELRRMNDAQKTAFAERILNDPRFREKLGRNFEKIAEIEFSEEWEERDEKAAEAEREKELKQAQYDEINQRWVENQAKLSQFSRNEVGLGTGTKARELDALRAEKTTLENEAESARRAKEAIERRIEGLRREQAHGRRDYGEIEAEIETSNQELSRLTDEFNEKTSRLQKIVQLEEEENRLNEEKRNLEKERAEKKRELDDAKDKAVRAKRRLDDARRNRVDQEDLAAEGMEDLIKDTTSEYLREELQGVASFFDQELQDFKDKTKDAHEKAAAQALDTYYTSARTVRRGVFKRRSEEVRIIDKLKVRNDYNEMLRTGNLDSITKQILTNQTNPETGRDYTIDEINDLMKKPEFKTNIQGLIGEQLIGKKILTEGLSAQDVDFISSSSWGQGLIEKAISRNEAARAELEKVMGQGAINQPGFFEKFRHQLRENPWLWLFLILAPVVAAGSAMAMSKEKQMSTPA